MTEIASRGEMALVWTVLIATSASAWLVPVFFR
jgi:hypothetical protein